MKKPNLNVQLGKLKLTSPIVCASGTFGFGEEFIGLVDFKRIGAMVTKTITINPRSGNPPPRIYETECGVLNSVGLENPGLDAFLREKLYRFPDCSCRRIVSCGGFDFTEYEQIVYRLDLEDKVQALEINLSCPNLKMKKIISQDAKLTGQLIKRLRAITNKTLIVKLTAEVTDICEIAAAAQHAGADAVSLINTLFAMAINIDQRKPYLGNIYGGYSGRAIKPIALYSVWKTAQAITIPIIGGGGITNSSDAIEFILAGASAVSVGTANLADPAAGEKITQGIEQYLSKNKIKDINQIRGKIIKEGK